MWRKGPALLARRFSDRSPHGPEFGPADRRRLAIVALSIIEDDAEHPWRGVRIVRVQMRLAEARPVGVEQERLAIAVTDALDVAVRSSGAIALAGPFDIDVNVVFGSVIVEDRIALVVIAAANEPTEDAFRERDGSAMRELASIP